VAASSPRASLGRRTVCGRTEQRRLRDLKRCETKVRVVWGSVLITEAVLKTPTRNGYTAEGVNLKFPLRCLFPGSATGGCRVDVHRAAAALAARRAGQRAASARAPIQPASRARPHLFHAAVSKGTIHFTPGHLPLALVPWQPGWSPKS